MITTIESDDQFEKIVLSEEKPVILYFHGDFSSESMQMLSTLENISADPDCSDKCHLCTVDVGKVKGLHKRYGVENVPALIVFREGEETERLLGRQQSESLKKVFQGTKRTFTTADGEERKIPRVTVYTTPTCAFCTKIKNHLKGHGIPYTEIDIAKDSRAADELVKKTGQTGVPQTFIGSQYVIGFDQPKIDRLLGLQ